jgi:hypothetical protein
MIERVWRHFTDRRVFCDDCGIFLGFVVRRGHRRWRCEQCSEYRRVTAVV